jgi:ribonuclease P protein component
VVVSKKVAKKAHDRNRLRRRLYALLRELIPSEMVCIVVAKPAITHLTKSQFQAVVRAEIADVFTSR